MRKLVIREVVENVEIEVYQNEELIGKIYNTLQLNDIRCQVYKFKLDNVVLKWKENDIEVIANLNNRGRIIDNHPPLNTYEEQINYLIDLSLDYDTKLTAMYG